MKKFFSYLSKNPWRLLYIFLIIALIWDLIEDYDEYTLKELIKSIILGLVLIWGLFIDTKNLNAEAHKNDLKQ
jgi:hypothetical protein